MQVGEQIKVGSATVRMTKAAQPVGQYRPTTVNAQKADAEFRITAVGSKNTIAWASGKVERVTDAKLAKLQAAHTWATDF